MRLVRVGVAIWEVLAIEDERGNSVWDELKAADPASGSAIQMRATLKTYVPENGPMRMHKRKCVSLGQDIYEFKEPGWRVLWFYDAGRRVVCTHSCPKVKTKEFQPEIKRAARFRDMYFAAKSAGELVILDLPKEDKETAP
jgi:hypothetical protein